VEDLHRYRCRRGREPYHFLPALEALDHLLAIDGGGELVASGSEVLGNGPIGGKEPLRLAWGLQPLHAPLPLAGGLV
jgi:hypothetical protein